MPFRQMPKQVQHPKQNLTKVLAVRQNDAPYITKRRKNTLNVRESNNFAWNFLMLFLQKSSKKNSGAKANSL